MKPGRKLDALVAEYVMGFRLKHSVGNTFWVDSNGYEPDHSCEFSTDIAAAWEVVEQLISLDLEYKLNFIAPINGQWNVLLSKLDDLDRTCDSIASIEDSAPHAICLAALKAVGYEVKSDG